MKNIIAFVLLAFSFAVIGQPSGYFTAVIVNDIDASIEWYSNVLLLEVVNNNHYPDRGFKQANLQNKNTLIELIEFENSLKPSDLLKDYPPRTRVDGLFKTGFIVPDFDKHIESLKANGIDVGNIVADRIREKRMVILRDPDGNRIQLFEE